MRYLKEGTFAKEYRARVEVDRRPSAEVAEALVGRRYDVAQQTPSRVAHRRADKVRERWIEVLGVALEPAEENLLD